jgi:Ca2+:H+ antiporter
MSIKPSLNWLLVFVPVAVVLDKSAGASASLVFFAAALAIVPIAGLIVRATEQVATRTGDAIGGLLNATFGNAPELIIAIVALRAGLLDIVRASIIGAILANLLLAQGAAFLYGGLRYRDQRFNADGARAYSSMMLIAAISLAVPSAFSRFFAPAGAVREIAALNVGIAVVLLLAYGLYLVFSLKTHPGTFATENADASAPHTEAHWSLARSIGSLLVASILAAWMSEILVGAAEETGKQLHMSHTFIGIVILAIVGGAAESGSAVAMAGKNKADLTVGIALGSCIQIALFVAPVLVLLSHWIAPAPLELSFNRAEIGSLLLGVLIGTIVCGDGRSNWFKGVQLLTVYAILCLMFYFVPELQA